MSSSEVKTEWPRDFRMAASTGSATPRFWSHGLYRGPRGQPVRILYSRTKLHSDEIAHEFLGESVVGFDMEWPWEKKDQAEVPLQQRIGLIQIATDDKIGLFHIGLHHGKTPQDVLAPALRKIIESEEITKAGVGILNADFARLQKWFGLKPRGAFELSHLHNLVTYGANHPEKATTRLRALSKQVEEHLGFPLHKGKVRTSNWSRPLNNAQMQYAAADAYAGLMLYHCMNAERLAMDPVPPIPLHAETYLPMRQGMGSILPVRLGPSSKTATGISAFDFFQDVSKVGNGLQPVHNGMALLAEVQDDDQDVHSRNERGREEEALAEVEDTLRSGDQAVLPTTRKAPPGFQRVLRANTSQDIKSLGDVAEVHGGAVASREQEDMGLVVVGRVSRQLLHEQHKAGESSKLPWPCHSEPAAQIAHQAKAVPERRTAPASKKAYKPTSEAAKHLFTHLSAHRKRIASEIGCAAFMVARNTLLTAISENCPRNEQELLKIKGVGKKKAELYGPAWLGIVRDFLKEQAVATASVQPGIAMPTPQPTTPVSRRTHAPKAISEASGGSYWRTTPAVLHTGISFSMENATLAPEADYTVIAISDDSDENSAFGSPMRSPSPSTLKRKRELLDASARTRPAPGQSQPPPRPPPPARTAAAVAQQAPLPPPRAEPERPAPPRRPQPRAAPKQQPCPARPARPARPAAGPSSHQTAEAKILRNKLLAFNRRVTAAVVLSEATIEQIVRRPPRTAQELLQIPDIMPFANACARQNQCLLAFIKKSAPEKMVASGT